MRITIYGIPPEILALYINDPIDFCFSYGEINILTSKSIAEFIAPILKGQKSINSYTFSASHPRNILISFLKLVKGNQVVISKKNASLFYQIAQEVNNTNLQEISGYLLTKSSPIQDIEHLISQEQRHLPYTNELFISPNILIYIIKN